MTRLENAELKLSTVLYSTGQTGWESLCGTRQEVRIHRELCPPLEGDVVLGGEYPSALAGPEPVAVPVDERRQGAEDARLVRYLANQVRRKVQQLVDRSRS